MADRIPSLDGIRAAAVLLVVLAHIEPSLNNPPFPLAAVMSSFGGLGVRIFFVLSGFLITNLLLSEMSATGSLSLGRFYLRRTLRIFPPYYALLAVVALAWTAGKVTLNDGDLLAALTYTMNYHVPAAWTLGHAWSLAVEEQFYLLWPAVLLFMRKSGPWVLVGAIVMAPLARAAYYPFGDMQMLYRFEASADSLAMGCLLAYIQHQPLFTRAVSVINRAPALLILSIFALAYLNQTRFHREFVVIGIAAGNLLAAIFLGWSMVHFRGVIGTFLNSRAMAFVGKMSYSIYLWQQVFLAPEHRRIFAGLVLTAAAATCSYYLIERPAFRLRRRRLESLRNPSRIPAT